MKEKKSNFELLFVGLAFFATYFGAGNLIFPPMLGLESGTQWLPGIIGLIVSGITLPLLSIVIFGYMDDMEQWMNDHIGIKFYKTYLFLMLVLGCQLAAVPRTGAVGIELGVQSISSSIPYIPAVIVYFIIVIFFTKTEESALDHIGKILTPLMVIILFILVIKNIIFPVDTPVDTGIGNGAFIHTLLGGYSTGDLIVSFLMASVFLGTVKAKGYKTGKECGNATLKAAIVAFVCLSVIYGGLLYLGACGGNNFDASTGNAPLLIGLIEMGGGTLARQALGVAVTLACLTTAIGETTATSQFFYKELKGKVKYRYISIVWALISMFVSLIGLNKLLSIIGPLFATFYAVGLTLLLLLILRKITPNDSANRGAVYFVMVFALAELLVTYAPNIPVLSTAVHSVPLQYLGFGWVTPFILGYVFGIIWGSAKKKSLYPFSA